MKIVNIKASCLALLLLAILLISYVPSISSAKRKRFASVLQKNHKIKNRNKRPGNGVEDATDNTEKVVSLTEVESLNGTGYSFDDYMREGGSQLSNNLQGETLKETDNLNQTKTKTDIKRKKYRSRSRSRRN